MAIGTAAAILGGSVLSGAAGAIGSSKAASAQRAAAADQTALEKYIYDDTVKRFEPYYQGGLDYNNALRYELLGGDVPMIGGTDYEISTIQVPGSGGFGGFGFGGKGDNQHIVNALNGNVWKNPNGPRRTQNLVRPEQVEDRAGNRSRFPNGIRNGGSTTKYQVGGNVFDTLAEAQQWAKDNKGGHAYKGYEATPMFKRALAEGQAAIDSSAASRGNVFSGATLEAQQTLGTELALQDYGNYLNRLTGQAAQGQAAAGNIATAGSNYASGAGTAMANAGNAQAAGYIGQANALTGAINNAFGAWGYMNQPRNMMTASNGVQVPTNTFNSVQALF